MQKKIFFPLFLVIAMGVLFTLWVRSNGWWPLSLGYIVPYGQCKDCNIILISLDSLRARSLPCFGYHQNSAPNLCQFAEKSLLFPNAYATAGKTLDSHMSLFTALYPRSHSMNVPFVSQLSPAIETLPEFLEKEGYQTYYFGPFGDPHLPLSMGLGRGFEKTYEADDPESWIATIEQLEKERSFFQTKFFAFFHTYLVHEPYLPKPETFRMFYDGKEAIHVSQQDLCRYTYEKLIQIHPERAVGGIRSDTNYCRELDRYQLRYSATEADFNEAYVLNNDYYWSTFNRLDETERKRYTYAMYLASVYELDQKLAAFFAYLEKRELLSRTIIVITSDHGDEFFEHGGYSHGGTLYDEVIRVPLVIYIPKTKPQTVAKLVSLIDIMPTVLGILGKRTAQNISGINMLSFQKHTMVLAEHVTDGVVAMITSRYKLIRTKSAGTQREELFDLRVDPGEQVNLSEKRRGVVQSLTRQYEKLQVRLPHFPSFQKPMPTWLDEQKRKDLIQKGYY